MTVLAMPKWPFYDIAAPQRRRMSIKPLRQPARGT